MYVCDNALVTDLLNKRGIGAYKGATQLKMIEAPSGFPPTHNIHEFFDHVIGLLDTIHAHQRQGLLFQVLGAGVE